MSEWISVNGKLPETGERVIICLDNCEVFEGWHNGKGWDRYNNYIGTLEEFMGCSVTHWMPLPEPPKGE